MWYDMMWYDMMCDERWCVMIWYDLIWCDERWCNVMWCDKRWCNVISGDVMWFDVMWCDVVWCVVMWCVVMWFEVKATLKVSTQLASTGKIKMAVPKPNFNNSNYKKNKWCWDSNSRFPRAWQGRTDRKTYINVLRTSVRENWTYWISHQCSRRTTVKFSRRGSDCLPSSVRICPTNRKM